MELKNKKKLVSSHIQWFPLLYNGARTNGAKTALVSNGAKKHMHPKVETGTWSDYFIFVPEESRFKRTSISIGKKPNIPKGFGDRIH